MISMHINIIDICYNDPNTSNYHFGAHRYIFKFQLQYLGSGTQIRPDAICHIIFITNAFLLAQLPYGTDVGNESERLYACLGVKKTYC
jgi:hypothetical protein